MKSRWLPTMPLHVANWMADPAVRLLSKEHRADLIDALCQSWMVGRSVPVPSPIAEAYGDIWRETERAMAKALATAEKNAARAKTAADARWDAPSNAPSIPSSNAQSKDPNPNPNPNPKALSESKTDKRRRGTRLPDDTMLTPEWQKIASDEGVPTSEVERVFREFVGYWTSLPGQKATKLDWTKTWRNRCLDQAPRFRQRTPEPNDRRNSRAPVEPVTRGQESVVVKPDPEFERRYREQERQRRERAAQGG